MAQREHHRQVVFRSPRRDTCMELRLVLESAGVANQAIYEAGEWLLVVSDENEAAALAELADYRRDNPAKAPIAPSRVPTFGGATLGAVVFAVVMVMIGAISGRAESKPLWHAAGAMQTGQVMAGELWRNVTALTLHADAEHLGSNLAFGCLFGFMAGRILGGGVAWLTIIVSGALGNWLNASMRPDHHTSIGASTAVFAALGVLVAHALHPRFNYHEKALQRWKPLVGGILLLGFIGVGGERTDVGAHVTGFVAGLVLGWLAARIPERWLASPRVQISAATAALATILLAWVAAVAMAN